MARSRRARTLSCVNDHANAPLNRLDRIRRLVWEQWLARFFLRDVVMLAAFLAFVACAYVFIAVADEVQEGETQQIDERVLQALRRADNPAVPIGPSWLMETGLDVTALGGAPVVVLVVVAVVGFLLLKRRYDYTWIVILSSVGGALLSRLLKHSFGRPRPTVVLHLREVISSSFPSGHAMLSAAVYLTLGALLTEIVKDRKAKLYCLAVAMLLTLLIGASRVYLGVHYPTDVLAGWSVGTAWAIACWTGARWLARRGVAKKSPPDDLLGSDPS